MLCNAHFISGQATEKQVDVTRITTVSFQICIFPNFSHYSNLANIPNSDQSQNTTRYYNYEKKVDKHELPNKAEVGQVFRRSKRPLLTGQTHSINQI
jgi:hypothetical protein